MNKAISLCAVLAGAALLAGCSIVKVSEAGKKVRIVNSDQVQLCKRLGTVSTSVIDNVLFVPRNDDKVRTELDKLARDQAVLMEANTLVRVSIQDGQGSYVAYDCPAQAQSPNRREGTSVIAHPVN